MKTTLSPEDIKEVASEEGLALKKIARTLDINWSWMNRAFMGSEKYSFINPNPERMKRISDYVLAYKAFQDSWRE